MAQSVSSLKTECGLSQLNDLLSDRSYVAGGGQATPEDLAHFAQISVLPDRKRFPHVHRWHRQIAELRARYAPYHEWSSKKGPRAAGKEKQQLLIDCQAQPVSDRRRPTDRPLPEGAGSSCMAGSADGSRGRYYITTAINYCNGWPHIGHAYEALTADVFARYHRMLGQDVFFMTGADEHGQKIAQVAEAESLRPLEVCDRYCFGFRALNERLCVSNDFYVRTTETRHKDVARAMWKRCKDKGDIYLSRYEGWYLVREERFITEQEAQEWNFKDPGSGAPLKKMSEPSFFFRTSKYHQAVIKHIEENESFVQPQQYRNEILERLRSIEMRDLSISRGTFEWGVECPEDEVDGKQHVMYVWFDALINYLSGIDGIDASKPLSRFWPANMHIVGKDIIWFHAVYWPAMLMSAGVPLPKSIVVHGFIAGADGRKMSKSYGNVVDPHDLLDKLPSDTVRWYFCRESPYGDDIKFSEDSLRLMHNSELCDNLGNLVNRAVTLCGGAVPECDPTLVKAPFDLAALKTAVQEAFDAYRLHEAAELTIRACAATNKWIADLEPWKMKEDRQALRAACCRLLLEAVYVLAHFFAPFIPNAASAVFLKIGTPARPIPDLADRFTNLRSGSEVKSGSILFEQLAIQKADPAPGKDKEPAAPTAKAAAKAAAKVSAAKGATKETAAKAPAAEAAGSVPADDGSNEAAICKIDLRCGRIISCGRVPDADSLYLLQVNVGEERPRQVVSGLVKHYKEDQLEGRKVMVYCNIKPTKMRGFESQAMVLAASKGKGTDEEKVELLSPPEDTREGARPSCGGLAVGSLSESVSTKNISKVWGQVQPLLLTNDAGEATFAGKTLTIGEVAIKAPSLTGAPIF